LRQVSSYCHISRGNLRALGKQLSSASAQLRASMFHAAFRF
jgi:hypothetical protein